MVRKIPNPETAIGLVRIQADILRFGRYLLTFVGLPAFLANAGPLVLRGEAGLFLWLQAATLTFALGASWVARAVPPRTQAVILGIPALLFSVLSLGQWGPSFGSGILQMAVLTLLLVFFYASLRTFLLLSFVVLAADAFLATAIVQGWIPAPDPQLLDAHDPANWIRIFVSAAATVPITAFVLARVLQSLLGALRESEARFQQLRREQAEKEEAQRALSRAQRMEVVGRLASGLSHDFNNTLTIIRGTAEILQMETMGEEERELAEDIIRAADNAADLSRRLLIFSRQGETSEPRPVDLGASLERLGRSLRRLLPSDIEVAIRFNATRAAHVDPSQMDQAILNLSLNARDAMPRGGRLELSAEDAEMGDGSPGVRLRVRDSGVGMDPDTLARALEPFFSTKEEGKGTGLGLAMVKKMADQHGGTLDVESAPGAGSTFQLVLPAWAGGAVEMTRSTPREGKAGRILVLDDDPLLRRVLTRTLEDAGHSVVALGRAEEAGAILAAGECFHLLVTDGIPAPEASRSLPETFLERCPSGQILVYSGHPREALLERGILPGDRVVLASKPLPSQELLRLVGERVSLAQGS